MSISIPSERIWFFDFDGTLARIVPERNDASLHPACSDMLEQIVALPLQQVAVLSSRRLDDLASRIPLDGLFLGGSSGTEWQVPGGHRMALSGKPAQQLEVVREKLVPMIMQLANLTGVVLEDKHWSIALHTRHAPDSSRLELVRRLKGWDPGCRVRVFRGPEVYEIQLLPRINKAFGVRILCRFLKVSIKPGMLVYAGDDENDAIAMRLVTRLGGTAITVGERPLLPTASVVADPAALAEKVLRLAGIGESG